MSEKTASSKIFFDRRGVKTKTSYTNHNTMTSRTRFKDYSEQDFINDKDFQDWVISSDEEKDRFWQEFLARHPEKKETVEKAKMLLRAIAFKETWPADEKVERSLTEALNTINQPCAKASAYRMHRKSGYMYQWMAAAAVLVFIVCGLWFLVGREGDGKPSVAVTPKVKQDIAPGGDKAILTLADGTQVVLDTANNGALTKQGNVTVIKLNGQLAYNKQGGIPTEVLYNTISTPRGGQYQLVLSDGSKVWLNAESSLRFPTAFAGKERRVELTGEGYFEVAHNAEKPFHVKVNDMEVQVLGTHFNINSYSDEEAVKTTLLEGSVKVSKGDKMVLLHPGQQAVVQPEGAEIKVGYDVDTEEVVAWKNGLFVFNNTPLATIMKQLERWYDVEVVYQGKVPQDRFNGSISRNNNLSEVLKVLEYSDIKFRVEGKTITVLP